MSEDLSASPRATENAIKKRVASKASVKALLAAIQSNDLSEVRRLAAKGANGEVERIAPLNAAAKLGSVSMVEALLPYCDMNPHPEASWRPSALMDAAYSGSLECVQAILPHDDAMFATNTGLTALMIAAVRPSLDILNFLLPFSAPDAVDKEGRNSLMLAAARGNLDVVRALRPVSDVNLQDGVGRTALMHAFSPLVHKNTQASDIEKHVRCFEALIPFSNGNLRDKHGNTALMNIAAGGQSACPLDVLEILINSSDASMTNDEGDSALTLAASSNCNGYAQSLLPVSEPNHQNASGETALIIAARRGNPGLVRLLDATTDLNLRDSRGNSAFMSCLDGQGDDEYSKPSIGHLRCAIRLLPRSEVNAQDGEGNSALMKAMKWSTLEIFDMMLPLANVNLQNIDGETALMIAGRGKEVFFELLLPIADLNIQDAQGQTALMRRVSHWDIDERLVARSNPDIQDNKGFTALMLAAKSGCEKFAEALLNVADARLKNREGKTARDLALEGKHISLAGRIEAVELMQHQNAELKTLLPEKKPKSKTTRRGPRTTGL